MTTCISSFAAEASVFTHSRPFAFAAARRRRTAKTGQNADWQRSQQQLLTNTEAITFQLEGDGKPLDFDSPLVKYTVTVDGKDVTASTTVQGNTLSFVPTVALLGDAISAGNKEVRVVAQSVLDPTAVAEAAAPLRITASKLSVEAEKPMLALTLHQLRGILLSRVSMVSSKYSAIQSLFVL